MDRTKVQCIHTLTRYLPGTWQSDQIQVLPQARGRPTTILTDNLTILVTCHTCLEQLKSSSRADQQSSGAPKVSRTGCDVAYPVHYCQTPQGVHRVLVVHSRSPLATYQSGAAAAAAAAEATALPLPGAAAAAWPTRRRTSVAPSSDLRASKTPGRGILEMIILWTCCTGY